MRKRILKKLVTLTVVVLTAAILVCVVSYLDRLLPRTSPVWIIAVMVLAVGSMLGVSWICDEGEAYLDRRAKDLRESNADGGDSRTHESWQVDPLDELRAEVYRVKLRPHPPERARWSLTRAWRGQ